MDILKALDPERAEQLTSRRGALQKAGKLGLGVALASVPAAFALSRSAYAQSGSGVIDVLNFALTLEYLEAAYYRMGVDSGVIEADDLNLFEEISNNETAHVAVLQTTIDNLGGTPVAEPTFDFTGGNGSGSGPFDPFSNYTHFLLLAQGFEDTGVRAYKGGAPALMSNPAILTAALQIHSVEARHASVVRRLVARRDIAAGQDGWIAGAGADSPQGLVDFGIYAGEDDQTVAGADVSVLDYSDELTTESYDEPLTVDEVLAIADPFIAD